jgi:hypothetical protein
MFSFGDVVVVEGEVEDGIVIGEDRTNVQICYCYQNEDSLTFTYSIRSVPKDKVKEA